MANDFTVACWLVNQQIIAHTVVQNFQEFREYHPSIISGYAPLDLQDYYFISNYEIGNLELNRAPKDEITSMVLTRLADSIKFHSNVSMNRLFFQLPISPNVCLADRRQQHKFL